MRCVIAVEVQTTLSDAPLIRRLYQEYEHAHDVSLVASDEECQRGLAASAERVFQVLNRCKGLNLVNRYYRLVARTWDRLNGSHLESASKKGLQPLRTAAKQRAGVLACGTIGGKITPTRDPCW